jgi:3-oxoacyl-[acyl-carrier protein] reductase/meso-butanediol dehydrogenase/(S,S)-butanediol dehydrogenase/diacetyl reductase
MGDDYFKGKMAFVTGAAAKRSMGRAIALRLAKVGANVAILDKYSCPKTNFPGDAEWRGLEEELEEIKACGVEGLVLVADVSSSEDCKTATAKVLDRFGGIDIFVHSAAIRGPVNVPVVDYSEEDWKAQMDVNLTGTFFISKPVVQHMVKRGGPGKIILISSLGAKMGAPGNAAYTASKWGVLGYTKSLALELAPLRINVNSICPGHINTDLRDNWIDEQAKIQGITPEEFRKKAYEQMASTVPLGREGTAEDVADLAMFLLSRQSDYMTGQGINIDGGICMT